MPHTPEQKKQYRKAKDAAAGIVRREYERTGMLGLFAESPKDWRREYKLRKRIKAGAKSRPEIAAAAQAKREAEAKVRLQKQKDAKHDAHVRRYMCVLSSRARSAKRYSANPIAERERIARHKQKLPDSYVIQNLKAAGISREVITPSLMELKREAMQYERLARHIKSAIKNHWKEEHETVTEHS